MSLRVGKYQVDILSLERFGLDGGAMFGIIPKPLWGKRVSVDENNRIAMGCQCLLIRDDTRVILVDAGMGSKWSAKDQKIYALEHPKSGIGNESKNSVSSNLERALFVHGLQLKDVTDVLVTHLHFDHAGGLTRLNVEDQLEPTFPQARHWIQASHLDWARNPSDKDKGSFLCQDIDPLVSHDLFTLVRGEEVLWSGIQVIPLAGHTRGMQAVLIDGNPKLFYPTDLLPMTAHLHLPYIMAYDIEPLITIQEKKCWLKEASLGGWHTVFEHEPTQTLGCIVEYQGRYQLST